MGLYRRTTRNKKFMGYYVHQPIPKADDDYIIVSDDPKYVHRPDLLSFDLYGTTDFWWVFGVMNGWQDLIHDLDVGMEFHAPSQARVIRL